MKIRHMSVKKTLEAIEKAQKNCPGSRYERDLKQHLKTLKIKGGGKIK